MKFIKKKLYLFIITLILILITIIVGLKLYVNAAASVSTQETTMTRMISALSRTKDTNNNLNATIMQQELDKYLGTGKATAQESAGNQSVTYSNSNNAYTINDNLEYTITYDANGGTGTLASQTKKFGHRVKIHSSEVTRDNHTFLGWSTDSSATTAMYKPGDAYMANENATLYAVWKIIEVALADLTAGTSGSPVTTGSSITATSTSSSSYDLTGINSVSFTLEMSGDAWYWATNPDGGSCDAISNIAYLVFSDGSTISLGSSNGDLTVDLSEKTDTQKSSVKLKRNINLLLYICY